MSATHPAAAAATAAPEVRSLPLLATLAASGALAGLLIVLAYQWTLPAVEANRAARLDAAVRQVLHGIDRYDTLYLANGGLTTTLPAGAAQNTVEKVYAGFDGAGNRVGFAIRSGPAGFADTIELLIGFNPAKRQTIGLAILSSRETPGLGDKILAESWLAEFRDAVAPLVGVKKGAKASPSDVQMITGATISSRAVISGVNTAVERWTPILDAYLAGGGS
jgi:electron transport complex protein RnfG